MSRLIIEDAMHVFNNGDFSVDEARDGKSTQEHLDGIVYVKQMLQEGRKIMPILAVERFDGTFQRLDGFKRAMAYKELGRQYIEAFVCDEAEYANCRDVHFLDGTMRCWHGGQPKETYPLLEGMEANPVGYEHTVFLYKNDNRHDGLRIEMAECIHVHWSSFGKYRLDLGTKDFEELALAFMAIASHLPYGKN